MAKTSLYLVRDADIWTSLGRANIGDVVELDTTEARYFNDKGMLAPYIADDDPVEEDIGDPLPPVEEAKKNVPPKR